MSAANAIMTVDRYLELSGDNLESQSVDRKQIARLIDTVSDVLENHLGRKIVTPSDDVTEYIYGHTGPVYHAQEGRINSLTSLSYQDTVSATDGSITWTLMTTADYPRIVSQDAGRFEFVHGHIFTPGTRYKFVYSAGWAISAVPDPIVMVGVMLIKRWLKSLDDKEGVTSKSVGDQTTSYDLSKLMTARHRELLQKYRVY